MNDSEALGQKLGYRPEIDGLRAFAVLAVIINHFNKDILPSGFLGVDIFFVVSGYVITASLSGRRSESFSGFLIGFYARRIKRLLPALAAFVILTSVLISLFNDQPQTSINTGIASLFGMSNLYLLKLSTDYFAQSTQLNPFTHTWSLGVEEQFYLLFPLIVWHTGFARGSRNGVRNLFAWSCGLATLSLVHYLSLSAHNYVAAYYLMPARFWEMAAGCIIYLGFTKRVGIELALEKVPPLLVVLAMVGVMSLPLTLAVPAKIAMVVLTIVLIASLKKPTLAFSIFTNKLVVYLGLISYSLYLWHWSVLSVSRWTIGIDWWTVPIQLALMVGLAISSYRWIEKPFRYGDLLASKASIFGFGFLIVAVTSLASKAMANVAPRLFTGDQTSSTNPLEAVERHLDGFNDEVKKVVARSRRCNINPNPKLIPSLAGLASAQQTVNACLPEDRSIKSKIVLLGDSFAEDALPLMAAIADRQGFDFGAIFGYGCPVPLFNATLKSGLHSGCDEAKEKIVYDSILARIKPGDIVALRLYKSGVVYLGYSSDLARSVRAYDHALNAFHRELGQKGAQLLVIGGNPTLNLSQTIQLSPQWFNQPQTAGSATFPFDNTMETRVWQKHEQTLPAVAKANGWTFFPVKSYLCARSSCKLRQDGNSLYYNENHLTAYATSLFQSDLERTIKAMASRRPLLPTADQ